MRIGVYTQSLRLNYGGVLQAWALQTALARRGHEATVLDREHVYRLPCWKRPLAYGKRLLLKATGHPVDLFFEDRLDRTCSILMANMRAFIGRHLRQRIYDDIREIREGDFDVLLAGSDQVWRPRYNGEKKRTIENAFFDFARNWNVRRVAYAASFGTDEWEFTPKQTRACAALAKKFETVSVRERSGIALCREHFGVEAVQMPDPTLLLERKDYEALIGDGTPTRKPEGDLFCYILDRSVRTEDFIQCVARRNGWTPFRLGIWDGSLPKRGEEVHPQAPVEQWLRSFRDAKAVVTDSFHACVFSAVFGKPFVVLGNPERGMARYESLLGELGLHRRLVLSPEEGAAAFEWGGDWPPAGLQEALDGLRRRGNAFLDGLF